jgi:NAD(P)-dependent dehydrogenase (short-subunit alcohol dehydrogenase family)
MTKRKIFSGFNWIAALAILAAILPGMAQAKPATLTFEEVSQKIPFTHRSQDIGGNGLGGAVWFDYDRDGKLDLFLGNGPGLKSALYHNNGNGTFTDVAEAAGVTVTSGVTAAVAGDLDNDGYQELLLSGDGGFLHDTPAAIHLFRNNRNGTFTDVTAASGITLPEDQTGAALGDIDNDGLLDVFIGAPGSMPHQVQYRNRLYHNDGHLKFSDVSAEAGVDTAIGACVASFSDYDQDGWIDLFVANCGDVQARPTPMELFHNNGNGTFTEVAQQVGLTGQGLWMGLALGDFDNDGDIDVFVSNAGVAPPLGVLPHALFRNNGDGTFTDIGPQLGTDKLRWGWGSAMRDFDNDGWPDLFFTGAFPSPFDPTVFVGPNGEGNYGVLWHNNQNGTFTDLSTTLPHDFRHDYSTGVAAGDFDGDGFEDLVVMLTALPPLAQSGQPVLLRNKGNGNRWLKVRAVGTASNRDGVGARVSVRSASLVQTQEIYAGSSLNSMHSQVLNFGLGKKTEGTVDVRWPSGFRNRIYHVQAGEELTFPEIPCSYDQPGQSLHDYRRCVANALDSLGQQGIVPRAERGRILSSAMRAWHEAH